MKCPSQSTRGSNRRADQARLSLGKTVGFDGSKNFVKDIGLTTGVNQVTPTWNLPFAIGPAKFKVEGFVDAICLQSVGGLGSRRAKPRVLEWV